MTAQQYIDQAVAAGIPLGAIQHFLSGNPQDEHRIMSALGPDYLGGSSTSSVSVSPSYAPAPSYAAPAPYYAPVVAPPPYATANQASGIFASSAADASLTGHGGLADNISRPQITIHDDRTGAPVATMMPARVSAPSIPPWMIMAAVALVLLLLLRK